MGAHITEPIETKRKVCSRSHKLPSPYIDRPKLEQDVKDLIENQSQKLVCLCGNVGSGKSTLAQQNLIGEKEYFPIQFPDVSPDEEPEIVMERFAEEIMYRCGALPSLSKTMKDFTKPTKHLISFLRSQGESTFILDPIDDVLRSEEVTKKLIEYLKLAQDSNVSFVLILSLIHI